MRLFIIFISAAFIANACNWFTPAPLKVTYTAINPSHYNAANGSIELFIAGGKKPYRIEWSNNYDSIRLTGLKAGKYLAMITDSKNKTVLINIELTCFDEPVSDYQGNQYKTIRFGNQIWMAENLRTTVKPEGTSIAFYYPAGDSSNVLKYGLLYTWETIMNGSVNEKTQGICPNGWHIPSDEEWTELTRQFPASEAGKILSDSIYGFNALAAGFYSNDYHSFGISANFWTSTQCADNAWKRFIHKSQNNVFRYHGLKNHAYSLRCVKNNSGKLAHN